ncbi:hypothetical protein [Luteimonas sp. MC1895]|uniref:hypothetical protein n=1 Tax=Luteimonas sp. MC1895 TaxID=2819513 RepID=UPI0018F0E7CD|nr:hypothetical protein [Luteimonas sp. MC1895]MBJ6977755.1 hypothetical protein [Luteimonas sp. MC1895]
MNRKLDNTLIALAASGLALTAIALFATPGFAPTDDAGLPAAAAVGDADPGIRERRGTALNRRGLAMPYFSFARGVRRIGG